MTDDLGSDLLIAIDDLDSLIHDAKRVPLTDEVRVERGAISGLVDRIQASIPRSVAGSGEGRAFAAEIDALRDLFRSAPAIPLSGQVRIGQEPVFDALDRLRETFPASIKELRWQERERREAERHGPVEAARIVREARRSAVVHGKSREKLLDLTAELEDMLVKDRFGLMGRARLDRGRALQLLDEAEAQVRVVVGEDHSVPANVLAPLEGARKKILSARPRGVSAGEIRLSRDRAAALAWDVQDIVTQLLLSRGSG